MCVCVCIYIYIHTYIHIYTDKRCYINLCVSLVQCRPPINGILKCPNEANTAVFGDTCTFSCKQGFNLQGQSTGTCLANGRWSGGNPICLVSGGLLHIIFRHVCICVYNNTVWLS